MVDIKKIYQQLEQEIPFGKSEKPLTQMIQRACLPLVIRALVLYQKQLNEDQQEPH